MYQSGPPTAEREGVPFVISRSYTARGSHPAPDRTSFLI